MSHESQELQSSRSEDHSFEIYLFRNHYPGCRGLTPLHAGTISFDDLDTSGGAVQLTNQYAASGVLFTNLFAAQQFKFNILPPSTPNYASPFWVDTNPGFITFVDPSNSSTPGVVDGLSFTLVGLSASDAHPGNFSGATLMTLDANGNTIETLIIPSVNTTTTDDTFILSGEIHSLEFIHTDGTTGAFPIDDLTFGTVTPVPRAVVVRVSSSRQRWAWPVRIRRRRARHTPRPVSEVA